MKTTIWNLAEAKGALPTKSHLFLPAPDKAGFPGRNLRGSLGGRGNQLAQHHSARKWQSWAASQQTPPDSSLPPPSGGPYPQTLLNHSRLFTYAIPAPELCSQPSHLSALSFLLREAQGTLGHKRVPLPFRSLILPPGSLLSTCDNVVSIC